MFRYIKIPCLLLSLVFLATTFFAASEVYGQAGTIQGTVLDPTGAVIQQAAVTLRNALTGYQQTTTTDEHGAFTFTNIPPNPYRLEVSSKGFETYRQDLDPKQARFKDDRVRRSFSQSLAIFPALIVAH
jgi:hypothetical protein